MNKSQIALMIAIIIILVGVVYFFFDKVDICNQAKNESHQIGSQQGVEFWNNFVIKTVNEQGKIPYIFNNTIQYTPIKQIYESQNE